MRYKKKNQITVIITDYDIKENKWKHFFKHWKSTSLRVPALASLDLGAFLQKRPKSSL